MHKEALVADAVEDEIAASKASEVANDGPDEPTDAIANQDAVTEEHFEKIVYAALEGVGGTLLFKMRVVTETGTEHVAAGSVGDGASRYFLILSMPSAGGELRVEEAAKSKNPVARIAASYAGLADALSAAA